MDPSALEAARTDRAAHRALRTGDLAQARQLFGRARANRQPSDRDQAISALFPRLDAVDARNRSAVREGLRTVLQRLAAPEPE